jgi:hypothetical protein
MIAFEKTDAEHQGLNIFDYDMTHATVTIFSKVLARYKLLKLQTIDSGAFSHTQNRLSIEKGENARKFATLRICMGL